MRTKGEKGMFGQRLRLARKRAGLSMRALAERMEPKITARRYDSVSDVDEIDAKADELRNAWNLGLDPVPSLCALLEEKGIKVIEDDLPERINGLACQVLRGGKPVADAVLVSSRTNVERKRLTLAHELAQRMIGSAGNPAIRPEPAMAASRSPS